ncbi:MAG: AzlC family ABC transporter permease [Pseudoruegeria sp.]
MSVSTPKTAYLRGLRHGAPFLVILLPFSMLFGVVAIEANLTIAQAMGFSLLVIAGAAQFAAVQLMTENAPMLVIVATALAVNMRMAMYSASLTPHIGKAPLGARAAISYFLVDQGYALSIMEYEKHPNETTANKVAYYFGTISLMCPLWYVFTLVGALIGARIPEEFALDFAVPIAFLAMTAPMLRTRAHITAAVTAVVLAILFAWVPYNGGLLIASISAMCVGAWVETRTEQPS